MVFSISSSILGQKLSNAAKVINSKDQESLPILRHFLFTVKDKVLTVTASDTENSIVITFDTLDCDGDVSFAVNAKTMTDAIKDIADQPVTFEVNDKLSKLSINYMNGVFNIPIENGNTYPTPKVIESQNTVNLKGSTLHKVICATIIATATDEIRPTMNGIFFAYGKETGLDVVATDGHKLVKYNLTNVINDKQENFCFILPKKPANLLKVLLAGCDNDVVVYTDGRNAIFKGNNFTLQCRLIEGRYPNYNAILPKSSAVTSLVDRKGFISSLKRVMNFSNENTQLVTLNVNEEGIGMKAEDVDFAISAKESFAAQNEGGEITIGVKAGTTADILSVFSAENVILGFNDPLRPVLITPQQQEENATFLAIIMPMIVN